MKFLQSISLALCLAAAPGLADEMPELDEIVEVRLLSGWTEASGARIGALQVTLAPGWKTYWRVAGETGLPPYFNWSGSVNLDRVEMLWPRPDLFVMEDIRFLGFQNELVLPIRFWPETTGAMEIAAAVEIGVCKDVCIPYGSTHVSLLETAGAEDRFLIELALADQPEQARDQAILRGDCTLVDADEGYRVIATIHNTAGFGADPMLVVEAAGPDLWVTPARAHIRDQTLQLTADILSMGDRIPPLVPADIRLTLIGAGRAMEVDGCTAF